MIFVKDIDVFLFYEEVKPKQIFLTSNILNKQLKKFLNNDKILEENIIYLDNIFNKLDIKKPKSMLDLSLEEYYKKPELELSEKYIKLFRDFGTIKHWKGDIKLKD